MTITQKINISDDEFGEYYASYISLSNGLPLDDQLNAQKNELLTILDALSEEEAEYRYEVGKWSIKEVLGHLIDTERIFCYRALAIARGESINLPGYNQDVYVTNAGFNSWPIANLKAQYITARESTLQVFSGFDDAALERKGLVDGFTFSARALGYVIAGHEHHHLNVLAERYIPGLA